MIRFVFAALAAVMFIGTSSDMYEGRPTIDQRNATGYYLWRTRDQWHLRWVAIDHSREFKGSVAVDSGTILSMKQVDSRAEGRTYLDWVKHLTVTVGRANGLGPQSGPPQQQSDDRTDIRNEGSTKIVFSARINDNIGGFDFTPGDSTTTLHFEMKFEGKPKADVIRIGQSGEKPAELPLVIRLK